MSSKSRGGAGKADGPSAKLLQTVLEATSCSEEEAKQMLLDCNNDANEAAARLLDGGAFAAVINKKQRRKQARSGSMQMHALHAAASVTLFGRWWRLDDPTPTSVSIGQQKEDEKRKDVPPKVLEVRRQPSASPAPRDRARGARGGERLNGRGEHPPLPLPVAAVTH
jgi:hypothetical protein